MPKYEPQTAAEYFALQRANAAAEKATAAAEAANKGAEINRSANERFYSSLALFSSGTLALSVTYIGYLKSVSKAIQHPHWLMACWICLIVCAACSLFWPFVYGYYAHYVHARIYAETLREKHEVEAKEFPTLARNAMSTETRAPLTHKDLEAFRGPRLHAAKECGENAKRAQKSEESYMRFWRWLGRTAQASFLSGLALLLAFAIKNM